MEFSVALRVNVEVANRAKQASGWLSSVNSFSVSSVERAMMQSGQAGRRLLWLSLRSPWEPTAERRQGRLAVLVALSESPLNSTVGKLQLVLCLCLTIGRAFLSTGGVLRIPQRVSGMVLRCQITASKCWFFVLAMILGGDTGGSDTASKCWFFSLWWSWRWHGWVRYCQRMLIFVLAMILEVTRVGSDTASKCWFLSLPMILEVTQVGQILPANADFCSCDDLGGDTGRSGTASKCWNIVQNVKYFYFFHQFCLKFRQLSQAPVW